MKEIFISYSKDLALDARQLSYDLTIEFREWKIDIDNVGSRKSRRDSVKRQIKRCDHVLVFVSKDGYETDDILKEEIGIALDASSKKGGDFSDFIIPIRADKCDPGAMGLRTFKAVDFFPDDREINNQKLFPMLKKAAGFHKLLSNPYIQSMVNNPLVHGVMANMIWAGLIQLAEKLATLDEDAAIPEYNAKYTPAALPIPGEPLRFLDPGSGDPAERWIKKYCDKEDYGYLAFFIHGEGGLSGGMEAPEPVNAFAPDELEALPVGTALVLIALGKDDKLLEAKENIEKGDPLDDASSDIFWLMYG